MKIIKKAVESLSIPSKQVGKTVQKRYYDDNLKGFGVRVTSGGTKAFFVEKLIKKKVRRITLGRYPEVSVEMAKKKAQKLLGEIAMGKDPIEEKRAEELRNITLNDVFSDYKSARSSLKQKTLIDYEQIINKAFCKWSKKPLLSITKDMVAKHHKKLGDAHGQAYANLSMRLLRALFNFAAGQYEDSLGRSLILENPVKRLSQTRSWYRIDRRRTYIKSHELFAWYQALLRVNNETLRDYLLLILFTGLRRQEAATLKFDQVDFNAKTLTINNTKNSEPHTLPLSDFLYEMLSLRVHSATSEYVFQGSGKTGHIVEPRRQMAKIIEMTSVHFTVHDLRRTFITIAESLEISAYSLKRLLNHKMNNDVTAGYIVTDVERLRKPMQLITDYLLSCMRCVSKNKS